MALTSHDLRAMVRQAIEDSMKWPPTQPAGFDAQDCREIALAAIRIADMHAAKGGSR